MVAGEERVQDTVDGVRRDRQRTAGAQFGEERPLGLDVRTLGDILALASDDAAPVEGVRLYPEYVAVATRLRQLVDQWSVAP